MIVHKLPLIKSHELAEIRITEFGEFMAFFYNGLNELYSAFVISAEKWQSAGLVGADFSEGNYEEFCRYIDDEGNASYYVGKDFQPTQEIDRALRVVRPETKTKARIVDSNSFHRDNVIRQVFFETFDIHNNGCAMLIVSEGEPGHRIIVSEKKLQFPTVSPDNLTIAVYSPSTFEFIIYDNPLAIT